MPRSISASFVVSYCWVGLHCTDTPHFVYPLTSDGHWGFFHFGAIRQSTAINSHFTSLCVDRCFISLGQYLGVVLLGHTANLCSTF